MTLLSVVRDVCASVGVNMPTSVFTNLAGNRTMQEMLSLANEMAQRTAWDTREWTRLKKTNVFTGDGVLAPPPPGGDGLMHGTIGFDLPANYKRMLKTSNVWRSTSALQPMRFIPNTDEWIQRRALNRFAPWGEWTIIGGQMLIWPIMAAAVAATSSPAETATFAYMDKNCVALNSGGYGDSFMDDGDSFALDERLLKLGMLWQWKAQKGSPYAEDMGTWADALGTAQGADQPAPIIIGTMPSSTMIIGNTAYPYPVPTP